MTKELDELIARVEGATICNKSLLWDVAKTLGVSLDAPYTDGPTTLGILIDARAWESAARVLVESKLQADFIDVFFDVGGWFAVVGVFKNEWQKWRANDGAAMPTPALALLAALLRALRTGGDNG